MATLIKLEHIQKRYRESWVLSDLSLEIMKGEYVAILGRSGSGKTTLLNVLACLDRPNAGHYFLNDIPIHTLDEDARARFRAENIGVVFQSFFLLPYLSALENVRLALRYQSSPFEEGRALEALTQVGLREYANRKPSELSGGQQQRIAIARALVTGPKVIVADEPTGALDHTTAEDILLLFKTLQKELGLTLIVVTHDHNIAEAADRILTLKKGQIDESLPVA